MTTSFSREGGTPEHKPKRRSRRLAGPGRKALDDLTLLFLIYLSDEMGLNGDRTRERNAKWLHGSLVQWRKLYG